MTQDPAALIAAQVAGARGTDLPASTVAAPVSSGAAESVFSDSTSGVQQRFYRVELVP